MLKLTVSSLPHLGLSHNYLIIKYMLLESNTSQLRDKGFNRPKITYYRLKNGFTRPKYFDDQIDQILFL